MQPKIRVSLVAEKDKDARKLIRLFEQFPEFAVVDTFAAAGNGAKTFDVQVVQLSLAIILQRRMGRLFTLFLTVYGPTNSALRTPCSRRMRQRRKSGRQPWRLQLGCR
jgi:hypothetical protein